jgi:hypothetical protein
MVRRISRKQLAANRSNALRSTGPRTPAGKIRSRENALRHGLTATQLLLPGETAEAFDSFRIEIIESLDPVGATENFWADRIACLMWRLRRLPVYEAALYHHHDAGAMRTNFFASRCIPNAEDNGNGEPIEEESDIPGEAGGDDDSQIKGTVVRQLLTDGLLERLGRYDAGLQRQLRDALRTLADLQTERQLADRDAAEVQDAEIIEDDLEGEGFASESGSSDPVGDTLGSA